ncbi:MAG: hypothetical protein J6A48_08745, partial [Clostridia bacterium]|nr:hypothetical protein [Clostridia bacterium]
QASVPAMNGEWGTESMHEQMLPGYLTTQLDNTTDSAMMMLAVYEGNEPMLERVAECYTYVSDATAYQTYLRYGETGSKDLMYVPVARYWHGYLVLLKPLLLFLSYIDIRMVLTLAEGAMLAGVIAGLCKRKLWRLIPGFALSLVFITPTAAGLSMQFSTVFCTFLIGMLALLYLPTKYFEGHGLPLFFLLVGMCTSFVDYLTYPVAAFGMPMVLCLFLFPAKTAGEEWKRLIVCGLCWALGYFGMWAGKWVIAGLFGKEQWFWANLLAKITERSSNVSDEVTLGYSDVLKAVLTIFVKRAYLLAAMAVLVAWLALLIRGVRKQWPACRMPMGRQLALLGIALLPFAWFFFTKNHTYNHAYFTSRSLCVTAFALSAWLAGFVRRLPEPQEGLSGRK